MMTTTSRVEPRSEGGPGNGRGGWKEVATSVRVEVCVCACVRACVRARGMRGAMVDRPGMRRRSLVLSPSCLRCRTVGQHVVTLPSPHCQRRRRRREEGSTLGVPTSRRRRRSTDVRACCPQRARVTLTQAPQPRQPGPGRGAAQRVSKGNWERAPRAELSSAQLSSAARPTSCPAERGVGPAQPPADAAHGVCVARAPRPRAARCATALGPSQWQRHGGAATQQSPSHSSSTSEAGCARTHARAQEKSHAAAGGHVGDGLTD